MSKKEKRLLHIFKTPPPKDFTWDELISTMESSDFKNHCTGGSHYTFEHKTGIKLGVSKTHPSGILKKYQIVEVTSVLERLGYKPQGI